MAPNRRARQFTVDGVAVNTIWVGDISRLPTREGFLHLATVLDLSSRRCVGLAMRDTLDVEGVLSTLRRAQNARRLAPGLIFHSDRGSPTRTQPVVATGAVCVERSSSTNASAGVRQPGAFRGRVFSASATAASSEARCAIFRYIETWYDRKRRHSTLGYISPAECEVQPQMAA